VAEHQAYVARTGTIKLLVQLPNKTESIFLKNVLHILGLRCNLFSTTLMAKKHGLQFIGKVDSCEFMRDGMIHLTSTLQHDMYLLGVRLLQII
jgi:hypothetical protein